jgi:hypothetical protein
VTYDYVAGADYRCSADYEIYCGTTNTAVGNEGAILLTIF